MYNNNAQSPSALRCTAKTATRSCSLDELMSRIKRGNLAARHELLGRYYSIIAATASRMTRNRRDAEDLAGDIYLHVFNVLPSCNNTKTLPGWIKRVVINKCYEKYRSEQRQPRQNSLEAVVETCGDSILCADPSQNPETILQETERSERLNKALHSLPEHQLFLCELYYVQSHTFEQIAHETGLPMGTIKSRLFRARETLQRKLGGFFRASS